MTTPTFTDALQAEVATLQAQHPILAGALDKAFTLVSGGHVFPLDDGRTAHVRSQSDPHVSHLVNGTCTCKATQFHAAPCAHRLAFRVYQRTVERLTVAPEEEERWEPVADPEPVTQPLALPEAPASINVRVTIAGREVQWTLRDTDESRLATRLEALLARYPVPTPTSPPASTQGKDWCQQHGIAMQENHKDGRTWWSHKTTDGWCKGRK